MLIVATSHMGSFTVRMFLGLKSGSGHKSRDRRGFNPHLEHFLFFFLVIYYFLPVCYVSVEIHFSSLIAPAHVVLSTVTALYRERLITASWRVEWKRCVVMDSRVKHCDPLRECAV